MRCSEKVFREILRTLFPADHIFVRFEHGFRSSDTAEPARRCGRMSRCGWTKTILGADSQPVEREGDRKGDFMLSAGTQEPIMRNTAEAEDSLSASENLLAGTPGAAAPAQA